MTVRRAAAGDVGGAERRAGGAGRAEDGTAAGREFGRETGFAADRAVGRPVVRAAGRALVGREGEGEGGELDGRGVRAPVMARRAASAAHAPACALSSTRTADGRGATGGAAPPPRVGETGGGSGRVRRTRMTGSRAAQTFALGRVVVVTARVVVVVAGRAVVVVVDGRVVVVVGGRLVVGAAGAVHVVVGGIGATGAPPP